MFSRCHFPEYLKYTVQVGAIALFCLKFGGSQ